MSSPSLLEQCRYLPGGNSIFRYPAVGALDISLRVQCVQAKRLVSEMVAADILNEDTHVHVIGAGMGGVSASLAAAEIGIRVTLTDSAVKPFSRQARCTTRWIDPYEYEWPNEVWMAQKFPTDLDRDTLLTWQCGFASDIALDLTEQFEELSKTRFSENLKCVFGSSEPRLTASALFDSLNSYPDRVYLLCLGRTENCEIGQFNGFRYWDADPYNRSDLDLSLHKPRVLISGGGDGALQDCIRVVCGRRPREIMNVLNEAWIGLSDWKQLKAALPLFEPDPVVCHSQFEELLANYLSRSSEHDAILGELLTPLKTRSVTLVHQGNGFSRCYPLNRLLVILFAQYARKNDLPFFVRKEMKTETIRGIEHSCGSPLGCHGEKHAVTLINGNQTYTDEFDVIIVRHGSKLRVLP